MTEEKKEPVLFTDPINGEKIRVQSVCYPSKTLLHGKEYTRANEQLGQKGIGNDYRSTSR